MLKTFKPFLLGFTIEYTGLLSGVSCAIAHQTFFLVDCNLVAMISLSLLLLPQPAISMRSTFFQRLSFLLLYVYGCKYVCLCTTCMSGAHGGQKVSDPLELESQMLVSCHMGSGNGTWILCRIQVFLTAKPALWPRDQVFKIPYVSKTM